MPTDPRIKVVDHGVFKSTGQHLWLMDYFCWTIKVWWNGKAPVTWDTLDASVAEGGDCKQSILNECKKKGMALAWAEVRKRNAKTSGQLSLF